MAEFRVIVTDSARDYASTTSFAYDAINRLAQVDRNGRHPRYAYDDDHREVGYAAGSQ